MGMLLERLSCKPAAMALRPVLAGRIAAAMAKQEGEQLLARAHQVHRRIHSGSDQVAKRFVRGVWNPYRRQVAGPVQYRQLLRIAPVGLNPLSRLARDHRWRDHHALVPERSELAMNPVPTAARFVAEVELPVLRESLRHLGYIVCRVRNHSQKSHGAVPSIFCNADRDGLLVNIHPNK
jgi:hypothetical protein